MYNLFRSALPLKCIKDLYCISLFKVNSKAQLTYHLNLLLFVQATCLGNSASVVTDSKKRLLIQYVCDLHPAHYLRSLD